MCSCRDNFFLFLPWSTYIFSQKAINDAFNIASKAKYEKEKVSFFWRISCFSTCSRWWRTSWKWSSSGYFSGPSGWRTTFTRSSVLITRNNLREEPNLGFQLRRLGRDPCNQQGRLPKGRNEVRRKRRKNSNLVSGKSLRSGWGRRTTGRRSSTASTWPTRRERTPFSLWYWSPTSMSYIWKDEDYEREWFHQIRMIDVGCYICSWAKDCISDKVSSLTCFCAGVLCLGRTQEHELLGQHGRQRLEYSQLFATLQN